MIAFGSAQGQLGLAAAGAGLALVVVVIAGVLAKGPLSRVPENTIKFVVGLLLTSFGCFWGAEGAGVDWPGDELSLLGVIAFFALVSLVLVRALRREIGPRPLPPGPGREVRPLVRPLLVELHRRRRLARRRRRGRRVWGVTYLLTHNGVNAWWLLPASVALVLTESLRRAVRRGGRAAARIPLMPSLKHPLTPFVDELPIPPRLVVQRAGAGSSFGSRRPSIASIAISHRRASGPTTDPFRARRSRSSAAWSSRCVGRTTSAGPSAGRRHRRAGVSRSTASRRSAAWPQRWRAGCGSGRALRLLRRAPPRRHDARPRATAGRRTSPPPVRPCSTRIRTISARRCCGTTTT